MCRARKKRDKTPDHLPVLPPPARQLFVYGHPDRLREWIGNFIRWINTIRNKYGWKCRSSRATHGFKENER